jgi:hypothetical protein
LIQNRDWVEFTQAMEFAFLAEVRKTA